MPDSDTTDAPTWDAVILAGGRASRLGGIDKTALEWRGTPLVGHAIAAAAEAARVCVVGPSGTPSSRLTGGAPTEAGPSEGGQPPSGPAAVGPPRPAASDTSGQSPLGRILSVREEPPFSGPASAIVAGLAALMEDATPFIAVLAADLPRVAEALPLLLAELPGLSAEFDGVMAVDESGRAQTLLAVYRAAPLRLAALAIDGPNRPVRAIVGALSLREVPLPSELCVDVDTAADAAALRITLPTGD